MSQIKRQKPVRDPEAVKAARELAALYELKELALALMLEASGCMMTFKLSELNRIKEMFLGIEPRMIESQYIGEEKLIVFSLVPKKETIN